MTKFGKLLAVFIAAASLAFAGFAIATVFGGPDWLQMTQAGYLDYYKFTQGPAPDFTWTATRIADGQTVATSKRLPEVLSKVLDEVATRQQTELQTLTEREPILQTRVESLEKAKASDEAALVEYETQLRARLAATRVQEAELATKIIAATNEAQKLENVTEARREDVIRLQQQINELRADEFRLVAVQTQLQNLLIQFQGDQIRAKARQQSLQNQLQ
ncbi:hypothetical protein [Planctomicrobium piriforme]|uniref:Uncharacterized protein n=1 Tax=Planctomicrobium piriforme TaxID=1576369 RepID=A0A1I3J123_9PLAN|nr:hypothetical protein [Planctomicrobium piriforme]SFI53796.1 hypothetical protein SAMN05421753_11020 [Planctomicrobium piriforme]